MFVQIHESNTEKTAHNDSVSYPIAIGIDLGTTNSLVAWAVNGTIKSLDTDIIIPSCVAYGQKDVVVGKAAVKLKNHENITVLQSVKRLMGKTAKEENFGFFPFAEEQESEKMPRLVTQQGLVTPVEVSASILTHLKVCAEHQLGKSITKAVITVPAYFDEAAKLATKQAAQLAGLDVLRLLSEPTAAALAYGLQNQSEGLYIVYDLGGGTFDVSLLNLVQGVFQVIATKGDGHLGGDDIDQYIAEQFRLHRRNQGIVEQWGFVEYQQALQMATQIKHDLSTAAQSEILLTVNEQSSTHQLTRQQLDEWILPFIQRTSNIVQDILSQAPANEKIQGIILVGGSTKIPFIHKYLQEMFGLPLLTNIDPDRVVAWGAALQAAALTEGADTLLLDIVPLSLGIETMGGLVEQIIPRNTPIPTKKTQQFTTFADFQQGILLNVVQGERETAQDCRSLARFEIKGIPPLPSGKARVEVTFIVDADGLLTVEAVEKETGRIQTVEVKPLYGLSEQDIKRILLSSLEHRQFDQQQRHQIEHDLEKKKNSAGI